MTYYLAIISSAILASLTTFLFHNKYKTISPIFASASLTLIAFIICKYLLNETSLPTDEIPLTFIGGTFVGMSTRKKAKNTVNIILASLFFCLIYFKSSYFFQGYGGALGLSACISVLIVITSSKLIIRSKYHIKKRKNIDSLLNKKTN